MPQNDLKTDPNLANAWKTKAGCDLTDAELLAMPDSEYMSDQQLEFFRMRLTALRADSGRLPGTSSAVSRRRAFVSVPCAAALPATV